MEQDNIIVGKIEIIERYHQAANDKGKMRIDKIERTVIWDGEEIYKEITEPLRKSGSVLGNFIEWILYKRQPKEYSNKIASEELQQQLKEMLLQAANSLQFVFPENDEAKKYPHTVDGKKPTTSANITT